MEKLNNKIYVIEGPDGTGKSTLARSIANHYKGSIIHAGYRPGMNVEEYHRDIMSAATDLAFHGDTVVLDRWALSEFVYGTAFRAGPSYNTEAIMDELDEQSPVAIEWIYCRHDDAVENHLRNKEARQEMFDDMTLVVKLFASYIKNTKREWRTFDYGKTTIKEFMTEGK